MSPRGGVRKVSIGMASQQQIAANRGNAQHSTGPRTPQGKDRSKLNAQSHGYASQGFYVPAGLEAEFERLRDALTKEWDPNSETERQAVSRFLHASWNLFLIGCEEARCLESAGRSAAENAEFQSWTETPAEDALRKLARYRALHERSQRQALTMLLALRKTRLDNAARREKAQLALDKMHKQLDRGAEVNANMLEEIKRLNFATGAERTQSPEPEDPSFDEYMANRMRNRPCRQVTLEDVMRLGEKIGAK